MNDKLTITCERNYLAGALGVVNRAIHERNTLPILSHVLLLAEDDRLILTSTDLDTTIRCEIPASVKTTGAIAVPASGLIDYVSKLPDAPISLKLIDTNLHAHCKNSRFRFHGSPAKDFPETVAVEGGIDLSIPSGTLKEMLRLTTFAASKKVEKGALQGVLFKAEKDTLTLVATDTHRLASYVSKMACSIDESVEALIPAAPLVELERVLTNSEDELVSIRFNSIHAKFETNGAMVISRLLDGSGFPKWEKVIPKSFKQEATFKRSELYDSVRRLHITASTASNKVVATFANGSLNMEAESAEAGKTEEEIPISFNGPSLTAGYNSEYLSQVLGLLTDDHLTLGINGPLSPAILRQGNDFLYIVMPMQV